MLEQTLKKEDNIQISDIKIQMTIFRAMTAASRVVREYENNS